MLHLARPLQDQDLQGHHERALAVRAEGDPTVPDKVWGHDRIFVSIAAFRDPECQRTIADLFAKADRPERVTVGLVRQMDPVEDIDHLAGPEIPVDRVRELRFDWRESRGVCWARFLAQSLWRGEAYFLQIDAHMIFAKGWDTALVDELRRCPNDKSLLSFASPPYLSPGDVLSDLYPGLLSTGPFHDCGGIRFTGVWPTEPVEEQFRMPFILAGGVFGPGEMIRDVPYDPYQCFALEEASYAVRLFTHGWDVYSVTERTMWHQYRQNNTLKRKTNYDAAHEARTMDMTRRAYMRFDHMTRHGRSTHPRDTADLDMFGLGEARTLAAYEDFSGVDFRNKQVSEYALRARYIPNISEVVKFSVACLDSASHAPPAMMSETERLLRIAMREWSIEQLSDEMVGVMLAIAKSDLADVFQMRKGAEIFARREALKHDFMNWDQAALVSELARLVASVERVNAAAEVPDTRQAPPQALSA
ncbi:Glycosyltransferase (GlcNAc) [Methylobacterium sp. ap11]|uniref:GlcNAc-transferase family protein n=1 Tax=Methylobacterium sp. ap11 TaxID=1761799 RepID=UPI0008CF5064|nr:GlcNAc-transferase family protein [Methylobacterium sp. ap11]SEP07598.1 Glycosyltransferase (GlcNAc) [Methylobacterium sp. ap11]